MSRVREDPAQFFWRALQAGFLARMPKEYDRGYTPGMKTAISIPDALFEAAERLAKDRGWSRSRLYANAVTAFIESERFTGVRERLDAIYGAGQEQSAVDPVLKRLQSRSVAKEKW